MAQPKAIIKKISAALKMASIKLVIPLTVLGCLTEVGFSIASGIDRTNLENQISQSQIVMEMREEELGNVEQQFLDKEISAADYADRIKEIESKDFVDEVIDRPELAEQKALLKSKKDFYMSGVLISGGVSLIVCGYGLYLAFNKRNLVEKICESAERDLEEAKRIEGNEPMMIDI